MTEITRKYKIRGLIAVCKQAIKQGKIEKLTKYLKELKRIKNV